MSEKPLFHGSCTVAEQSQKYQISQYRSKSEVQDHKHIEIEELIKFLTWFEANDGRSRRKSSNNPAYYQNFFPSILFLQPLVSQAKITVGFASPRRIRHNNSGDLKRPEKRAEVRNCRGRGERIATVTVHHMTAWQFIPPFYLL
jgi:hypothetical protein